MKRQMMDILVCPECKGQLVITVISEAQGDIITGSLSCGTCEIDFPIANSVPNFMNASDKRN